MHAVKWGQLRSFKTLDENLQTLPRTEAKLSVHSLPPETHKEWEQGGVSSEDPISESPAPSLPRPPWDRSSREAGFDLKQNKLRPRLSGIRLDSGRNPTFSRMCVEGSGRRKDVFQNHRTGAAKEGGGFWGVAVGGAQSGREGPGSQGNASPLKVPPVLTSAPPRCPLSFSWLLR